MIVDWTYQELWEKYYKKKMEMFKQHLHIDVIRERVLETSEYKELLAHKEFIENEQSTSLRSSKGIETESGKGTCNM